MPEAKDFDTHTVSDPYPAVPAELKARRQWVLWLQEIRSGKPTKVPYQSTGRKAQANNPRTWTDYETALRHRDDFSGIGFVFSSSDPFCGIDLDHCLDEKGRAKDRAKPIVARLKEVGYGERSSSGRGIKFWTRAKLPEGTKHKAYLVTGADAIEAYDSVRYFTVTGQGRGVIRDGQDAIDWIVSEYLSAHTSTISSPQRHIGYIDPFRINRVKAYKSSR